MRYVLCAVWLNLQTYYIFRPQLLAAETPTRKEDRPCHVDSNFHFVSERTPSGSLLLELPTVHGETWSLSEADVQGYLTLNLSGNADNATLSFTRSPDIEEISARFGSRKESLSFTLRCEHSGWHYRFPQKVFIKDANEHPPKFDLRRSYNITIIESSIVGSRIVSLRRLAIDPDQPGQFITYDLEPYLGLQTDGRKHFKISEDNLYIVLVQIVDFDVMKTDGSIYFGLNISATDVGEPSPLTAYASLTITVADADDQPPAFKYPGCAKTNDHCSKPYFQAVVKCGYVGPLHMYPAQIAAEDRDTQNHSIIYSIVEVKPEKFVDKFDMSSLTGEIRVVKPSCALKAAEILLTIRATEDSKLQRSESATVQVDLLANSAIRDRIPGETGFHLLDLVHHGRGQQVEDSNYQGPSIKLLPFISFLVLFISFTIIGAIITYMSLRLARAKRRQRESNIGTTTPKQPKDGVLRDSKCPICQSYNCAGHADGITCFRACSAAQTYSSTFSGIDLNQSVRSSRFQNHLTQPTTLSEQSGYRVPSPPLPCARRGLRHNENAESTSNNVSNTSISSNSSNRSTTETPAREPSFQSPTAIKRPLTYVPTALTASSGYCRGGLFISCGRNVSPKSNSFKRDKTRKTPNHLGDGHSTDSKVDNSSTHSNKPDDVNKNPSDEREQEILESDSSDSTQGSMSLRERLKNKLNKMFTHFLRDENPKVRFDDRNISAFQEETRSIIY